MRNLPRMGLRALFTPLLLCLVPRGSHADENLKPLQVCDDKDHEENSKFNPLHETAKSAVTSAIGGGGGRRLMSVARLANGLFVREAGIISGRVFVFIFEVSNPFVVAIGYMVIPNATAKCDVQYSNDPDCLKQNPCIKLISSLSGIR